jgi:biopolymer transport protein ExbD
MLDILFVLLLFFMVCAGAQKHEASISTQLPGDGHDANIPINISIDIDGQVTCQGAPIDTATGDDLPNLIGRLQTIVKNNPGQPVIITPSPTTKHQRVIDVLNACAAAQVKNLAFGSSSE